MSYISTVRRSSSLVHSKDLTQGIVNDIVDYGDILRDSNGTTLKRAMRST